MPERTCSVQKCTAKVHGRGLCQAHYQRWRRTGEPQPIETMRTLPLGADLAEFIALRIKRDPETGCWIWRGAPSDTGYATVNHDGRTVNAHRISYEVHRGSIPSGLVIDHLCRVRLCVNPEHLEAVPQQINVLRGVSIFAVNAAKEFCDHGHEFTPANTYRRPDTGHRQCRECNHLRSVATARKRLLARQAARQR